jgi:hypothetical protein
MPYKNKADRNARFREHLKENREYILEYKCTHPCVDCGEPDPIVLNFHHLNRREKKAPVARLLTGYWSMKVIVSEIEKCIVLCANCHRRRHYKESHQ